MIKETEKNISQINKYMEQLDFENEELLKREKSDDFLFEAYDEPIKSKAIKLAKKALEMDSDNIDAENFITKFETNTIKKLKKYKETLDKEQEKLERENMFDKENIGIFWGLMKTRPYMRTKYCYMLTLMELGRYNEAIKQGEELLTLCRNDNQGVRYSVIILYALLEKFEECEKLYKSYYDDTTYMLFPLSIMYYKKGNYTKSKKILKNIQVNNKYILEYIKQKIEFPKVMIDSFEANGTYSLGSKEEAYFVVKDNKCLLDTVPTFVEFIEREIK